MAQRKLGILVEHMEEQMWDWCILEYKDIFKAVSCDPQRLLITNVPKDQQFLFLSAFDSTSAPTITNLTLEEILFANDDKVYYDEKVVKIQTLKCLDFSRICLLDSEANDRLCPEDVDSFDWILLGGILGNVEEMDMDRTKELRKYEYKSRHLERMQMPTNIAARVSLLMLEKKIPWENIGFCDYPEFDVGPGEKLVIPFRFLKSRHVNNEDDEKDDKNYDEKEDDKSDDKKDDKKDDDKNNAFILPGVLDILLRENDLSLF